MLQVAPDAEPDAIRASFRALARHWHPDFGGDAHQMQTISEAWSILGRPDRRMAYDRDRASLRPNAHGATAASATQERAWAHATLDYGRYRGWTIEALADRDPDYLEWLRRTPAGRGWRSRIESALADRAARIPVPPAPTKRRGRFRR